jgi:2-iminobutanoate/2-iminopropanoate deaminase
MTQYIVKGEKIAKPGGPYTPGIQVGDYIFCSGQVGINPQTGEMGNTIEEQTRQVLTNLQAILQAAGASLSDAVKTTVFLADVTEFARMNAEYATFFPKNPPTRSTVGSIFPNPRMKIEIDLIAYVGPK